MITSSSICISEFTIHLILHRSYLSFVYVDRDGDVDRDDDGGGCDAYASLPSRAHVAHGLGRRCALIVRQLTCQRNLVASCYPGTYGRHCGSSWNV